MSITKPRDIVTVTKRTAPYVPPEPSQQTFNADLRAWLKSVDPNLSRWAEQTANAASAALRHLCDKHGVRPREVLSLLEQQKRFALIGDRDRERNPTALALAEQVKRFSAQPEHASILRYFGVEVGQTAKKVPHRPRDEWTERLVPLVNYFLERTGKPLWQYAGDLLAAAFPEFRATDIRESVKKRVKRFQPSDDDGPPVPPLHKIVGRDARRAAVKILGNIARQDVLAMEIAEINKKIEAQRKRPKSKRRKRAGGCDPLCSEMKEQYGKALRTRLKTQAGTWQTPGPNQLGGIFFLCGRCLKVCHDSHDGRVLVNGTNRCGRCVPRH